MPHIARTVIPRIKKSIRDRGLVVTLGRSLLLPGHLWKEYRAAKSLRPNPCPSEFDQANNVDTDGDFEGWTHLSDLDIPSPNWIEGRNYAAIEPRRFERVMASLDVALEDFTFIDYGSGKGRALLLASHYPFRRIIGLEFSPQLNRIAKQNIQRYCSPQQKCANIELRDMDFVDFPLPPEPSVLFFFDPCGERVLREVIKQVEHSLRDHPRPLCVAYVAPRPEQEQLLRSSTFLKETHRSGEANFCIYQTCQ